MKKSQPKQHLPIKNDQRGLVSFIVTLLLMIVISLIVLGFARITRREQRQALDRQLSAAAYYAAESGVNDAKDSINRTIASGGLVAEKTTCGPSGPLATPAYSPALSTTISYTCLLIDPFPTSLSFNPLDTTSSKIFPLAAQGGAVIDSVTFYWQGDGGGTNLSGCPASTTFPASWPSNCDTGILRVDLVPVTALDRASLVNNAMTTFLYPSTSGSGTVVSTDIKGLASQGKIVTGSCPVAGVPRQCSVTVSGLGGTSYYARIKAVYKKSNVTVKARNLLTGDLRLVGAQAIIDSTGRASDVVRRIQVNTPLLKAGKVPESIVDSIDSICKKFTVSSIAQIDPSVASKYACDIGTAPVPVPPIPPTPLPECSDGIDNDGNGITDYPYEDPSWCSDEFDTTESL